MATFLPRSFDLIRLLLTCIYIFSMRNILAKGFLVNCIINEYKLVAVRTNLVSAMLSPSRWL